MFTVANHDASNFSIIGFGPDHQIIMFIVFRPILPFLLRYTFWELGVSAQNHPGWINNTSGSFLVSLSGVLVAETELSETKKYIFKIHLKIQCRLNKIFDRISQFSTQSDSSIMTSWTDIPSQALESRKKVQVHNLN